MHKVLFLGLFLVSNYCFSSATSSDSSFNSSHPFSNMVRVVESEPTNICVSMPRAPITENTAKAIYERRLATMNRLEKAQKKTLAGNN